MRRAEILPEENAYNSRVFYIRSSDERVAIGEIINFRSEFEAAFPATAKEAGGGLFGQKFYLEVQLYFKEATQAEIEDAANLSAHISSADLKLFHVVNTRKFLLRNAQKNGFFQFYPVSFDQAYVSTCSVFIHSIVKGKRTTC